MSGWFASVVIGLATMVAVAGDDVPRLKLRPSAVVSGPRLTLGDVLSFADAIDLAEHLAREPLFADGDSAATVVTHDHVVRRLGELGVNLSKVLVDGAWQCVITRLPLAPAAPPALPQTAAAAPMAEVRTLADELRSVVAAQLADLGGTVELHFERAGQEFLRLTSPPFDFAVSTRGRDKLGLREFHVVIRRDGQVQRKVEMCAHVRLTRAVAVARRPLNPGNFIRPDDVELETRVFEQGTELGIGQLEEVIGQQVKRFVERGQMLTGASVQPVDLVRRSRPVTLLSDAGAVQVRLTGVALDSGGYGDVVRVRTGDVRRERRVLRGVVTGLGTVRLMEGES